MERMAKMKESEETPAMEAKSHPRSFLKKALADKSKKGAKKSAPRK